METDLQDKVYESPREVVKDLKVDIDYDTFEQAEPAGMVFSKNASKPASRSF
jgi:hypothetical protein